MITIHVEEIPDVYVDGTILPPYMGVKVEREPRPALHWSLVSLESRFPTSNRFGERGHSKAFFRRYNT